MKNTLFFILVFVILLTACSTPSSATPAPALPISQTATVPSASTETLTPTLSDSPATSTATSTVTPIVAAVSTLISPENFSQFSPVQVYGSRIDELLVEQFGIEPGKWRIDKWTYSPGGQYVAFGGCTSQASGDVVGCKGSDHSFLYLLDAKTAELTASIEETNVAFHGLSFSPDGKWLAYAVSPYRLVLWNMETQQTEKTLWQASGVAPYPDALISPDSRQVVLAVGSQVIVFDLETGERIVELPAGSYGSSLPKYTLDGTRLAIFSKEDGSEVAIYDTTAWEIIHRLQIAEGYVRAQSVDFSGDGRWLANAITREKTEIKLWEISTGELVATLQEPLGWVNLRFSPDGRLLLVGGSPIRESLYNVMGVWDISTRQRLGVIKGVGSPGRIMFDESGESFMINWIFEYSLWSLPDADLLTARQALTNMLDGMSAGDYETAARWYQPSEEEKGSLASMGFKGLSPADLPGTLAEICAQATEPCSMEYQIIYGGLDSNGAHLGDRRGEYLFILSFTSPDGSVYQDSYGQSDFYAYVDILKDGSAYVIYLPTLFYTP